MSKQLKAYEIHQGILRLGHKEIPSDSYWHYLDVQMDKVVIITSEQPIPRIFYVEQKDGKIIHFKAM